MQLIDIHTHKADCSETLAIVNSGNIAHTQLPCSVGIHPWDISSNIEKQLSIVSQSAANKNVIAIGECGFDLLKSSSTADEQMQTFASHIQISERVEKPLIIHLVKGQDYLIKASKIFPHKQAWIIHGFRGKPTQAQQLLTAGFYISLGEHFNKETAETVPLERLFIESDESNLTIEKIYEKIASVKRCTIEILAQEIANNCKRCRIFFDRVGNSTQP